MSKIEIDRSKRLLAELEVLAEKLLEGSHAPEGWGLFERLRYDGYYVLGKAIDDCRSNLRYWEGWEAEMPRQEPAAHHGDQVCGA